MTILADETDYKTRSTALVCIAPTPASAESHLRAAPNDSSFVTQLIATASGQPQTRKRRRAEPTDALAAYASASTASFTPCGRTRRIA